MVEPLWVNRDNLTTRTNDLGYSRCFFVTDRNVTTWVAPRSWAIFHRSQYYFQNYILLLIQDLQVMFFCTFVNLNCIKM